MPDNRNIFYCDNSSEESISTLKMFNSLSSFKVFTIMLESIRKFGLEYCDLPTMLWNVAILLRVLTLDIDSRYKKGIPPVFYILTIIVTISYLYVYVISVTWFVFIKCAETGDIVSAMVVFSLGTASEIAISKMFYMYIKKDLIRKIVAEFLDHDSRIDPETRFAKNMRKGLRVVKRRAMVFWTVIMSNGLIYCIKPIILPGRHLMEDSLIMYGLEPMHESPNYEIAFCLSACGVIFTCYLTANITAFFIVLTGYSEAQILALSEEITLMWDDANEYYRKNNGYKFVYKTNHKSKIINEYVRLKLIEIVNRHTINVDHLQQVEKAVRGAIGIEFMLLTVGLIAELLGGLENTYIEIPYTLMQVTMDCLVGQRVIDACITLENAMYDSKWENFDTANMKTILLMLQNSQKTMTFSAGGITILSFTSLMSILRSVYSAYTTLRSTVNKK